MSWLLWWDKKWCRWLESVCNDIFFLHTLFLTHFPTLMHGSCLFPLLQHRSHGCSPWGTIGHSQLQSLRVVPALICNNSVQEHISSCVPKNSSSMCLPMLPYFSLLRLLPPVAVTPKTSEQRHQVFLWLVVTLAHSGVFTSASESAATSCEQHGGVYGVPPLRAVCSPWDQIHTYKVREVLCGSCIYLLLRWQVRGQQARRPWSRSVT